MRTLRTALVHVVLILLTAATLYPVLWVLKMALSPSQSFSLSVNPWPTQLSLANFADVLFRQDGDGRYLFFRQLVNSLVVSAAVTVVGVSLSCSAAYALSRFRFPGRDGSLRLFLFAQMFPGVVTTIPLYVVLEKLHLLNHLGGLVLCYATTAIPFCVFMLKGYFDGLPQELEEAVLLDGGSRFDAFYRVVLPLALPGVVAGSIFTFSLTLGDFVVPSVLGNSSYFIGQAVLVHQGTSGNLPLAAAFTVVPMLIMGVYLIVARRMGAFNAL